MLEYYQWVTFGLTSETLTFFLLKDKSGNLSDKWCLGRKALNETCKGDVVENVMSGRFWLGAGSGSPPVEFDRIYLTSCLFSLQLYC